jgi:predicted permease
MLLAGATLLARSFERMLAQDPGFSPSRVTTVSVELPYSYTNWTRIADFYAQLLASLRARPEIAVASVTNFLPLEAAWRIPYVVEGRPRPPGGDEPQAQHQTIDDDYWRCLSVPLLKGRFFNARDTASAPGVVIVNETLAKRQWPGEDPVGRTIVSFARVIGPMGRSLMPAQASFQVIGVVADMKNASLLRRPEPAIYYTFRQFPFRGLHIVVQGQADTATLVGAVRVSVHRLDPNLPLSRAQTLERVLGEATDRPRALMLLMAVIAALAVALAALGIYSVLSFTVNQRRQELSVRMALGAQPRTVLWLVMKQGLWLTLLGSALGGAGVTVIGRTLSSLLYGVSPTDATAFGVAFVLAVATALTACVFPARRAAAIDPIEGLRAG